MIRKIFPAICLLVFSVTGAALAAGTDWRDFAAPYDKKRIAGIEQAIEKGNEEARGRGSAYDHAVIAGLVNAPGARIDKASLVGDWSCRTIKVGGPFAGLVVYDWFKCRITAHPDASLYFQKLTGSQRFAGPLFADGSRRMVLLAGGYYHDEEPRPYGAKDSAKGASPDNRDKAAVFQQLGPDWARMIFPYPARESTYDIVELRRSDAE